MFFLGQIKAAINICLDEGTFLLRLQKTPSRHPQHVLIKINIFTLVIRLLKTSSRHLQDFLIKTNIFVLVIRLQNVFKTSCKHVFRKSSRRLAKTSSRSLQNVFKTSLKDVFKTYHQVKLLLFVITSLRPLRHVSSTFLRRTAKTVIYGRICLGQPSEKFMVSVQNFQEC